MPQDPVIEPAALPSLGPFRLLDVREPAAFEADRPAKVVRVPIEACEAAAKAGFPWQQSSVRKRIKAPRVS
jgi:thiosulfate/3-mercaptopyruvate sulfurtransferase